MDQPVERLPEQRLPMRKRPPEPCGDPSLVNHHPGVLIQHPSDDLAWELTVTTPIGRRSESSSTAKAPGRRFEVRRSMTSSPE
jgi:hypothetical protein